MKNKKLFAILTLVCFMFTLMPVAAFAAVEKTYAEVDSDYTVIKAGKDIKINITNPQNEAYYVFALDSNGKLYSDLGDSGFLAIDVEVDEDATDDVVTYTIEDGIADADTYTIYVVEKTGDETTGTQGVVGDADLLKAEKVAKLLDETTVKMLTKEVTVKPVKTDYELTLNAATVTVDANSGYETKEVVATLTNHDEPVINAELTISTNSSAVDVNKTTVKTNAAGKATFKVSASTAGTFKVYVEYGTKADATLTVKAGALTPAKITTVYAPTAPVALDSTMIAPEIVFDITDANGNAIAADGMVRFDVVDEDDIDEDGDDEEIIAEQNFKATVTEKPAGSTIDADEITLYNNNGTWLLSGGATFDVEGDYTIKITLDNGNYATAKVTVKEFQTPVELKMSYKQNTVELDGEAILNKLFYVDANGVTKSVLDEERKVTEVGLSANGYAIESFNAETGKVTVKADEKYVGKTINVLAVSQKYNLTASVDLLVANEAAGVKYATNTADVAVNNTIKANIVDMDGNKVALKTTDSAYALDIKYVVLEKPANAKVAVSTASDADLIQKGEFKVSFTASEIGTYKVQTVVTYDQGEGVVKYYSGIEEITVGNTGFEDVVVLSIGSSTIVVNADAKAIDAAPIVENNRTFVPFRALAEAFGANVAYDEATQAVTAELDGITVVMTIGSATYTVNGVEATADVAPFIVDGRTMVPVRFVAEAFGITVTPTYDENGATADVIFAK